MNVQREEIRRALYNVKVDFVKGIKHKNTKKIQRLNYYELVGWKLTIAVLKKTYNPKR